MQTIRRTSPRGERDGLTKKEQQSMRVAIMLLEAGNDNAAQDLRAIFHRYTGEKA